MGPGQSRAGKARSWQTRLRPAPEGKAPVRAGARGEGARGAGARGAGASAAGVCIGSLRISQIVPVPAGVEAPRAARFVARFAERAAALPRRCRIGPTPGSRAYGSPEVRNEFWLSCQWVTVKSPADLEISVANEGRFSASGKTSSGSPILKRSRWVQHRALSVPQHDCRGWATQAIAVPDSTPDKPRDPDSQKSIRTCGTAVASRGGGEERLTPVR